MPAVGVPGGASSNTFFAEPCFGGDSARSWVVDRVCEFQSMKPYFAECPLGQCGYGLRVPALPLCVQAARRFQSCDRLFGVNSREDQCTYCAGEKDSSAV